MGFLGLFGGFGFLGGSVFSLSVYLFSCRFGLDSGFCFSFFVFLQRLYMSLVSYSIPLE